MRVTEGFINPLFKLKDAPLASYSCLRKRVKTYRVPSYGPIAHVVVDATGLKVFGEGVWKIRKHGKEKRRFWRKLHLTVDAQTQTIIAAEVSLERVSDNEVLKTLLNRCVVALS